MKILTATYNALTHAAVRLNNRYVGFEVFAEVTMESILSAGI
jgi:hypothetical protein